MNRLASRILPLSRDGADIKCFEGTYGAYEEYCKGAAQRLDTECAEQSLRTGKEEYLRTKKETAQKRKKLQDIQRITEEIKKTEARLTEVEAELFGEASSDYIRAAALDEERHALEAVLYELYEKEEGQ